MGEVVGLTLLDGLLRIVEVGLFDRDGHATGEHIIAEGEVGFAGAFLLLLAEGAEGDVLARDDDIVSVGVGREESVDTGGHESFLGDDFFEEVLRFVVEFLGDFGAFLVAGFESFGFGIPDAAKLPGVEERGPVDVVREFAKGLAFDDAGSGEFRDGRGVVFPVDLHFEGAGLLECDRFFFGSALEVFAEFFVFRVVGADEGCAGFGEEGGGHGDGAGGVEDMHERAGVVFGDFDCGVGGAGGGSADEDGDALFAEAALFSFFGDRDHLVERGRDEAGESDDVGLVFFDGIEDFVTRDHYAHIDDVEAIAGEDDADDVFTNVVNVAFYGGHDNLAV